MSIRLQNMPKEITHLFRNSNTELRTEPLVYILYLRYLKLVVFSSYQSDDSECHSSRFTAIGFKTSFRTMSSEKSYSCRPRHARHTFPTTRFKCFLHRQFGNVHNPKYVVPWALRLLARRQSRSAGSDNEFVQFALRFAIFINCSNSTQVLVDNAMREAAWFWDFQTCRMFPNNRMVVAGVVRIIQRFWRTLYRKCCKNNLSKSLGFISPR
jgi:hypothetical protein